MCAFPPPHPFNFPGISLSFSSPRVGKTDIAAEDTSVIVGTAFNAFVSVLTPVADEEDRSLHDREKNKTSEAVGPILSERNI